MPKFFHLPYQPSQHSRSLDFFFFFFLLISFCCANLEFSFICFLWTFFKTWMQVDHLDLRFHISCFGDLIFSAMFGVNYFSTVVVFSWVLACEPFFQRLWLLANHYLMSVVLERLFLNDRGAFGESLLNGSGAWKTISQLSWSLKDHLSTVVELKKLFLNGCGTWQANSQCYRPRTVVS